MKLFKECQCCDRRYVGCHANCPTYLRDRKRLDEANAKKRSANDYIAYYVSAVGKMKSKRRY